MADDLFTASQKAEAPENLSREIKSASLELQKEFLEQQVAVLYWNKAYVAIPLVVEVDLPTRGPVDDIDIREREPIYLLLDRQKYPYKAPSVWSNRRDFPASRLPHLNPTSPGMAANFCLHRGKLDDWFAEHTIVDVVHRVRAWLRDAARDRLIRREDGFETTRITETLGYSIYESNVIIRKIERFWTENDGKPGNEFQFFSLLKNPEKDPLLSKDTYAIRLLFPVPEEGIQTFLGLARKVNSLHSEQFHLDRLLFGILAWPSQMNVSKSYFTEMPNTLDRFQDWAEGLGIPVKEALQKYLSLGLQLFGGVPITLAIVRPQKLIGTQSPIELISFVVNAGGAHWPKDGEWNLEAEIKRMGHRTPLTLRRARDISSQSVDIDLGSLLFLGCGAVGSKLILHLARSGQGKMTVVDSDELSPHNMVRHGLLHESLGMNKAQAIKSAVEGIFYADDEVKIDIFKESALGILLGEMKEILTRHKWLIDTTASSGVLNVLTQADLPENLSCCRCEIADHGKLGFLFVEGPNRNPRLDDFQVIMFNMAIENPVLSRWLRSNKEEREKEVGSVLEEINIGISCSSETMRLSDEIVSLHSAAFAAGFRRFTIEEKKESGRLQINQNNETENLRTIVQQFDVSPMTILTARNDATWQVRLRYGLKEKLQTLLRQTRPNETGGLLIGIVNFKRRIIYVTQILPAPRDSVSSPYAFVRGIQDIPEEVLYIQELTGGLLGYVGEWHTHHPGGPELSEIDKETVDKIKTNLDSIPLPTHVMIVTLRGLYPHIFSPK